VGAAAERTLSRVCRILAIIGSGETSPTMVTIHKELVARLGSQRPNAVLLDTPYAFQENCADVSARAQAYFARSVGLDVAVAPGTDHPEQAGDRCPPSLRTADWVFAGPGSPSYALAKWRGSAVAQALRDRIGAGEGVTVLASAAAATMGFAAVPVYEIYKAGAAPHWLDGLDLLGELGLKVAVIPHFDNAEGGKHDTRYCYLGERRLSLLERALPDDAAVLGVDEHTAVVFDLHAETVEVCGRGVLSVRRRGSSTLVRSGTAITLTALRTLVRGGEWAAGRGLSRDPASPPSAEATRGAAPPVEVPKAEIPRALPEVTRDAERRFDAALHDRDAPGMVAAILDLEEAVHAWSADTDEDQGAEQARAMLRGLVTRLGRVAQGGVGDPYERLRHAVEPLLALRATLRRQGSYSTADAIRDALTAAGLQVHDTANGTSVAQRPSTGYKAASRGQHG